MKSHQERFAIFTSKSYLLPPYFFIRNANSQDLGLYHLITLVTEIIKGK
jgi:glycyl-tRNA synthetase beta subunit